VIELSPIIGGANKQAAWEKFRAFHYEPDVFNKSAECYLVRIDGSIVGFVASLPRRPPKKGLPPCWSPHKTAVRLPVTDPDYFRLWSQCADEQAKIHLARGHKFYAMAPMDHAAYRDVEGSGWIATCKDKRRQQDGYRSHEYVGEPAAPAVEPEMEYICSGCGGTFPSMIDRALHYKSCANTEPETASQRDYDRQYVSEIIGGEVSHSEQIAEPTSEPGELEITEAEVKEIIAGKDVVVHRTAAGNGNYHQLTFKRNGKFWRLEFSTTTGGKARVPKGALCEEVFPVAVTEYRAQDDETEIWENQPVASAEPAIIELKEGALVRINGRVFKLDHFTSFDEHGNSDDESAFTEVDHLEISADIVRSPAEMEKRTIAKFIAMSQKFPVFKTKVSQNGEGLITVWGEGFSAPSRIIDGHPVSDDEVGEGVDSFEEGEKLLKKINTAIQEDKKHAPVAAPKRKSKKADAQ
jgi:hypothetical protein